MNVSRKRIGLLDSQNLAERKEIDYLEGILREQRHTSQNNNLELDRVRGINDSLTEENN